ncbi:hypothetical protein [Olleya sp. ITB9]|uniref:hypothetical protein n=1 Tax=Olleya sp. ITB9 TaxID=1715648 RepID=UPI0006D0488F|nr:hypothetical protein [Olleya sp. ITB9]
MKIFSRLFIVVYSFILLSNCKQNSEKDKKEIITIQETNKPVEHKAKLKGLLDKNQFITSEWIEIEKSKSTFKNSKVKEE